MAFYTPFETAADAHAAFVVFVADHGGVDGTVALNAINNTFAVEVHDEYESDLHRWTVALETAKDYVDQNTEGY